MVFKKDSPLSIEFFVVGICFKFEYNIAYRDWNDQHHNNDNQDGDNNIECIAIWIWRLTP